MGYWACTFRLLVAIDWWPTAENRCCLQGWHRQITVFHHQKQYLIKTRSVTARFGRHGMPLPASKDTGTAFCFPNKEDTEMRHTDDVSLWLWPLILKLVHNVARVVAYHSANFGDTTTTIRFRFTGYCIARVDCCTVSTDLQMLVASKVGTFIPNLGMIGLQVLKLFAMYTRRTDTQTDRQTNGQTDGQTDKKQSLLPLPYGRGRSGIR